RLNILQKQFLRIRSVASFKHINELSRTSKRIINMVKKDPRRFYNAEQFFYAHLESAVTLVEKYSILNTQPLKDPEIKMALQETTHTLDTVQQLIDDDLKQVLSSDIEHLKLEIDFAKLSANEKKKTLDIE
ncbi:MAG: 5-bromo-4-chloroindolyl phosphate hydrolysis family protein, partial [Caryophanon sp.]|nr:5-bromo-4-chloroindolyl phosphate hydrolysis family protein [Caryophanon sp.]